LLEKEDMGVLRGGENMTDFIPEGCTLRIHYCPVCSGPMRRFEYAGRIWNMVFKCTFCDHTTLDVAPPKERFEGSCWVREEERL
jgi:hypothetical protein